MIEHELDGTDQRADLGDDYVIHAPGVRGVVRVVDADRSRGLDTTVRAAETTTETLEAALADAGLRPGKVLELSARVAGRTRDLGEGARGADRDGASVVLDVPVPPEQGCLLLVEDVATGALTWRLPENEILSARSLGGARGSLGTAQFVIPIRSGAHVEGARGFLPDLGKKIKTFFYDATDRLLGPIIHGFAKKWETSHRPSFTRTYGPDDYQIDDPRFRRVDADDWRRLARGRALLFVHGTFSTSGAFASIHPEVMTELSHRYEGRTFAFNHPTLTADPRENALAFLRDVPPDIALEVDIVCHSRGGLVAREIAALGAEAGTVKVRRIVFVGATNSGTALADPNHMVDMIDRFTTIAHVIPESPARKVIDALVLALKVIGHGFLDDLEGLRAMNPEGAFLGALNVAGGEVRELYAIGSNFEPPEKSPFLSLTRAGDAVVDRCFDGAANDLVVPLAGVFAAADAAGFPIRGDRTFQFPPSAGVIHTEFFGRAETNARLLDWLQPSDAPSRDVREAPRVDALARAFDAFRDQTLAAFGARNASRAATRQGPAFTPAELESLRPHVINLSEGSFKESGIYHTTEADVEAIVHEHIPKWAEGLEPKKPLRIVIWAHGGLIGERDGLAIALKHVAWWKRNGIYPLYFVWETGLFDALRSILESVRSRIPGLGGRDLWDFTLDPLVEKGVRALGGVQVWGAMKRNAELSSRENAGAYRTAALLRELVTSRERIGERDVELHAVGHSAGSNFHSWFLPTALDLGLPAFRSLQLLAPAITIDEFEQRLAPRIGESKGVDRAIMYTMKRSYEEADDCIGVYHKSLLYLIHHGLEARPETPILGLEMSLRSRPEVARLFGLVGAQNAPGRVVWSVSDATTGNAASRSTSHGGFDDDAATMGSVAANVLGVQKAPVPYTGSTRSVGGDWPIADEWLEGADVSVGMPVLSALGLAGGETSSVAGAPVGSSGKAPVAPKPAMAASGPASKTKPPTGKIKGRALCVGIDGYPGVNALHGCVNDTVQWSKALKGVGLEDVDTLLDGKATRETILSKLRSLIGESRAGEVLVFQYSGHGTQVTDTDDDEDDHEDEALVPVDFEQGAFLLDDDLREVFDLLPTGVNLTCFIDCCHSGTITRVLGRNPADEGDQRKARYLKRTPQWDDWMDAHGRYRIQLAATRALKRTIGRDGLRWVNYSACNSTEVAYEDNGSGDFTRYATRLLAEGAGRMTHREFQKAVLGAFGDRRRQTPQLDCADTVEARVLLQPLGLALK